MPRHSCRIPDTLELYVMGASCNENAYNRLETYPDFAYNSKKDGDLNAITCEGTAGRLLLHVHSVTRCQ